MIRRVEHVLVTPLVWACLLIGLAFLAAGSGLVWLVDRR